MFIAVLLPAANADLRLAARHYESWQSGLGKRVLKHVREKVELIRANLFAYSIRYGETERPSSMYFRS